MSAPAVAVTTLPQPTWVGAGGTLQATGSIPNGQSRWYRVVALDVNSVTGVRRHSLPSLEIGPFVADAVNRRVALSWNAVAGAAAYRVYVRTDAVPNPTYAETTPNALGVSAVGSFSTGTGTTFTDSVAAPICTRPFFPVGIVRAVLTAGEVATPGTPRSFYDAVLAASPANAAPLMPAAFSPDIIGAYFALAAYLEIGDGVTPTYFAAKDTCMFLVGGIKVNTAPGVGTTLILGEYDAATGRRSRGCSFYCAGYGTATRPFTSQVARINLFGDAAAELNDSYIEDLGKRGMVQVTGNGVLSGGADPGAVFGNDGLNLPITLRGTELACLNVNTSAPGQIVPATVQDLFVRQCYAAYTYSVTPGQVFANLAIEDSVVGLYCRIPTTHHRFINLRVLGRTEADIAYQVAFAAGRAILRDPVFGDAADDENPLLKQIAATAGATLEWESLVEVQVIDAQGVAVSGKTISILDVNGAVLASGVTDATGVVVGGMPVSYLIYTSLVTGALAAALMSAHVAAAKWSKTDRRPLTIQIAGSDGVEAFTLPFSPTGSVRYRLKLHPENASNIAGQVEVIEFGGVVGASEIAMVVGQEDVGGGVTTIEEI
jgi:hypothetical protein